MTFEQLCAAVLTIVKRPDMLVEIEQAVRSATLKAHRTNFYYRDMVEKSIQFQGPSYVHNFNPRDIFGPTYRKIGYIRPWHYSPQPPTYGQAGELLDMIGIEDSKDYWGVDKTNVYYQSGVLLQIRTAFPLSHALVGAFVNPTVATNTAFESWIAEEYPDAIICEAARGIAAATGNPQVATWQESLAREQYAQLALDSAHVEGE